jgi:hypothetical protein
MHKKSTMGQYADCYVLTNNRTKKFISDFLDTFIPNRKEQADVYEIPMYEKETIEEFDSADRLIDYLELNVNIPHTIYWENLDNGQISFANCFFTNDDNLIIGLACDVDKKIEGELLMKLMNYCGSTDGYITYERPAPHNSSEFKMLVRSTNAQQRL